MTGVRQSIVFQIEDTFGGGSPSFLDEVGLPMRYWVHAPPGSWFSSTHRRDTKRVQSMGSKFWDTVAYGPLSGTWEWTFYLDYNYPEPLFLVFEGDGSRNVSSRDTLKFVKSNNLRVPSFTVREKILDTPVDGAINEVHELTGCVVTDATFTRQANSSYIQVRLAGFYANESMKLYDEDLMDTTDYIDYDGELVEYACLTSGKLTGKEFDNAALIQNTDSVTISINNSAEAIYNTCAPFAQNFSEGLTKISFSASTYANHPSYYQLGVMTGGKDFNILDVLSGDETIHPGSKGMAPTQTVCLTSYDAMARNTSGIIGRAYAQSSKSSEFKLDKVVMSAIAHQRGDGSKLVDSVNNCPVRTLELTLKSIMRPYTLDVGSESWKDRFYFVPDESSSFKNNVFVEKTLIYRDADGIVYQLDASTRLAALFSVPADFSGDENGHFSIPESVEDADGRTYLVHRVADEAFRNTAERPVSLRSVHLPPTIDTIGNNAFRQIYTLESVTGGLPTPEYPDGGVKKIFAGAFFMSRTQSSLVDCDMVSSENSALEVVYPYAFGYARLKRIYIKPDCQYNMSSGSNSYAYGPFSNMGNHVTSAMNQYPEEIVLPLSANLTGVNEDGTLFQGLFYKTYSRRFVFYQDREYESASFVPEDLSAIQPGAVLKSMFSDQVIPASLPAFTTPWYWSMARFANPITIVFDQSVKDIPGGMFMMPDDTVVGSGTDEKMYSMDLSAISGFSSIGPFAFYNSYVDPEGTMGGVLEIRGGAGSYAFYNPQDVTAVVVSSNARVLGPDIVVYEEGSDESVTKIDLGGCTRCTAVKNAFKGMGSVQTLVMPPSVVNWYTSAVLAGNAEGEGWYRLGYYDASGTLTKLRVTNAVTGRVTEEFKPYLKGQEVVSDGRTFLVPRRFFRQDAAPEDIELGVHAALNTSEWTTVKWSSLSGTTWGSWSPYMWGEIGQYATLRTGGRSSLMSAPSPVAAIPSIMDDEASPAAEKDEDAPSEETEGEVDLG